MTASRAMSEPDASHVMNGLAVEGDPKPSHEPQERTAMTFDEAAAKVKDADKLTDDESETKDDQAREAEDALDRARDEAGDALEDGKGRAEEAKDRITGN